MDSFKEPKVSGLVYRGKDEAVLLLIETILRSGDGVCNFATNAQLS